MHFCDCALAGVAVVEPEGELVEVRLQMFGAQAAIHAKCPAFQVGVDAMCPRQDDVGGHRADDVRFVGDAEAAGIAPPAVGPGGRTGRAAGLGGT